MIFKTMGGLALAFLTGFALVAAFWPSRKQRWPVLAFQLALATGIGLGMCSASFFLMLAAFGGRRDPHFLADVVILLVALFAWWFKSRRLQQARLAVSSRSATPAASADPLTLFLGMLLIAGLAIALLGFGRLSGQRPHGQFDAWTIWNLHARFLFRGGDHWTDMFSPLLANYKSSMVTGPVGKPDYPLLLSASIARLWDYAGEETLIAPEVVAGVFTFATAALLLSVIALSRGTTQGFLAGLVLLGTPAFLADGASQISDVPLGFFLLATLGLLYLYDRYHEYGYLVLAGGTAGLGGWTKNEGVLLLIAILLVRFAADLGSLSLEAMWRRNAGFLAGMAPLLATVIYFKMRFAPSNDLLAGQGIHAFAARFASLIRYVTVGRAFASQAFVFGNWFFPALVMLALYGLLVGLNARARDQNFAPFKPLATVLVALTGYFFVYVGTPHQLEWHLSNSLDRVLMQLWPSALFGLFLLLNTPAEGVKEEKASGGNGTVP